MKMINIAFLAFGIVSNNAFAQSIESLNYKIVGAGNLKDGSFVAIVQNEDNSLSPAGVMCGAGSYFAFTGKERLYISTSNSKGVYNSADMTQVDCKMKIQSMREATLQNPVIIELDRKKD